jgi:hypothetical protein
MLGIEARFLDIILQLASMRQSLSATEALSLINSMVESSAVGEEVVEWKKNLPEQDESKNLENLGKSYWRKFKKRHPELKSQQAVQFDSKLEDWCMYENFEKMYSGVYAAMVKSRVAVELEEEVMVRLDGTITTNKDEQARRKTKYILTRPEFIFFVDEVGCNTSQKNDGNN